MQVDTITAKRATKTTKTHKAILYGFLITAIDNLYKLTPLIAIATIESMATATSKQIITLESLNLNLFIQIF